MARSEIDDWVDLVTADKGQLAVHYLKTTTLNVEPTSARTNPTMESSGLSRGLMKSDLTLKL